MVSSENMELIKNHKNLNYVLASRSNEESMFLEDFQNGEFTVLEDRESKSKTKVEVLLKRKGDETYLLCKSEGRKVKEKAIRNKVEEKLEGELTNLLKQIQNGREKNPVAIQRRIGRIKERYRKVSKYFKIEYHDQEFSFAISDKNDIPKRLWNSVEILHKKTKNNEISHKAVEKNLEKLKKHIHPIMIKCHFA